MNARLRSTGKPFLLPELMNMVFIELCAKVTPRFRLKRRFELVATGTFNGDLQAHHFGDLEYEATGDSVSDE